MNRVQIQYSILICKLDLYSTPRYKSDKRTRPFPDALWARHAFLPHLFVGEECVTIPKSVCRRLWCLRSNRVLVHQFSARHFVHCIVGRHEEKAWELIKSCSDQCLCPATVTRCLTRHRQKAVFRLVGLNGT